MTCQAISGEASGGRASTGTKDTLAAGTGDRYQVVVADEDAQVRAALKPSAIQP
jgi:hypothetical protein